MSSWASEGFQAPAMAPLATQLPQVPPRAGGLAHLRFPNADNPELDAALPLVSSNVLLSCVHFLCTCFLLTGSFSKSYAIISRQSVSLSPKPPLAWRRDVEQMLLAPESGAQDTSQSRMWVSLASRSHVAGADRTPEPSGALPYSTFPTRPVCT